MESEVLLSEYNIRLINFAHIYKDIEVNFINDLYHYNLLEDFKVNGNVRKLMMHHLIVGLCNTLMKYGGKEKNIVYFCKREILFDSLLSNTDKLLDVVIKCVTKIKRILPIRVYVYDVTFERAFIILSKQTGHREELISNIRSFCDNIDFVNFTFSKIKMFTQKNGLTFLNKDYFNTLKSKQLLLT
jgi:hypothetical protein